ncbi:hypothetical protein SODG_007211 [Sodalis praecaptivus]
MKRSGEAVKDDRHCKPGKNAAKCIVMQPGYDLMNPGDFPVAVTPIVQQTTAPVYYAQVS